VRMCNPLQTVWTRSEDTTLAPDDDTSTTRHTYYNTRASSHYKPQSSSLHVTSITFTHSTRLTD